jgi:tRNA threonylcarbamoyladenosine biosynthesis protein TsaE
MLTEPLSVIVASADLRRTGTLGQWLGRIARKGDVVLLHGDLGAGKTTLTQAIARGLDVPEDHYVTSPSFALLHEYPGRISLFHMDCYRLGGEDDIEGAGLIDYIGGPGMTVIEWPDRLGSLTPKERLDIIIEKTGENERKFTLVPCGVSWKRRVEEIEG